MTTFELYLITCCDAIRAAFFVLALFSFLCTFGYVNSVDAEKNEKMAKVWLVITMFFISVFVFVPSTPRAAYIFSAPLTVQSEDRALQKLSEQYINEIKLKDYEVVND